MKERTLPADSAQTAAAIPGRSAALLLATQRDDLLAQVTVLDEELAAARRTLISLSQRHMLWRAFAESATNSWSWRLLEPVRWLRSILRPMTVRRGDLIPFHNLVPADPTDVGRWTVGGADACFLAPCWLPAGWVNVRVRLTSAVLGQMVISFVDDPESTEPAAAETIDIFGEAAKSFYLWLPRPVLAVRFAPLNAPGEFHLHELCVTPVSYSGVLVQAVANKIAALRAHGLLGRAFKRGVKLVASGRFADLRRLLHDGNVTKPSTAPGASKPAEGPLRISTPPAEPTRKLDVVYVLKGVFQCGGVKVVLEHVSRLRQRGHNAQVYYLEGNPGWFQRRLPATVFPDVAALKGALKNYRGVKVATWNETAAWVHESLQPGDRGYYLIQDIEESYCDSAQKAAEFLRSYTLGLRPLTEAVWVHDQLRSRFGLESAMIGLGIDLDLFQPCPVARERTRILMPARTWSGGGPLGAYLKGWETARQVIRRCHQLNPSTTLTTYSIEEKPAFVRELPHIHQRAPADAQLARLYSQAGLFLLTSNHEGFGLPAAEAMACGCPVVATLADGNAEFCLHGETALTAPPGDAEQLARHCVTLQNDPQLADELARNARKLILTYTWDSVIDHVEREFLQSNPPEVSRVPSAPQAAKPAVNISGWGECVAVPLSVRSNEHWRRPGGIRRGEYPAVISDSPPSVTCSVVIPTVNDVQLAVQCVKSCRRHLPAGVSAQFIVVDDGTPDLRVQEALRQASAEHGFELLLNHQNLGFSATVNHGLRHARGRFLVLCNNDVVFCQPWWETVSRAFDADRDLGIAGIRLLYADDTIQHGGLIKVPGRVRWHHAYVRERADHPPAVQDRYVWAVTGALMVIRRDVAEVLGGLSTAYGTAFEDLDYCLHAWRSGYRVGYCGSVAAYHLEGTTRGATDYDKNSISMSWAARECAGRDYFEKKWVHLRHVESLAMFLPDKVETAATLHTASGATQESQRQAA